MTKFVDEVEPTTGMYCAYRVGRETAARIVEWARSQGLSHIMRPSKMHVTTMFSRRFIPTYVPASKPVGGTFDHFKTFPEKDGTGFSTLVAVVHSPALVDRWAEGQRQGATYDFPDYIPHISLGRVPNGFKVSSLKPFDFPLIFSNEYAQLKGGWGPSNSGYQLGNELMILGSASDDLDRMNDDSLYFVQPDGSFEKGGDRRGPGVRQDELPAGAVISSLFSRIRVQAEEKDLASRRRNRGQPVSAKLGETYIKIYRACAATENQIGPMDYVTRSPKFANEHAEHQAAVEGETYHVLQMIASTKDVYEAMNPGEYFYDGKPGRTKVVYRAEAE